jgi:hypothetical protein
VWNETFEFSISTEKEMIIEIFDKEQNGNDRPMGQNRVRERKYSIHQNFHIFIHRFFSKNIFDFCIPRWT